MVCYSSQGISLRSLSEELVSMKYRDIQYIGLQLSQVWV